jgi:hypothetical protein
MIEKLTKEQEAKFPEYIKKWTDIGLCTKRANRKEAERYCREAYKVAGLEEPKFIFWAESPLGLLMAAKLIKEVSKKYGTYDINSVWASVGASVGASVWDSVWDSVRASVWDSVRASVGASVGDSVRASVWDSVRASVGDSVGDSVRASVWDSVWDSVRASVWDSVRASVGDSVGDSVRASVWDSVRASVWDSVRASVWDSGFKEEWQECYSWGQHDASWLGFYNYFLEVLKLQKETEKLIPLMNLAAQTGWHLFYKNVAILSEKPTEVHRNERGQLHNFNGPAIKWADGYELYRFNGVRLDNKEQYAKLKPKQFTKEIFTKEENADVRRELIRKIGNERLLNILDYKVLDKMDEYELINFDIGDGRVRPFLKMKCATTDNVHIEGVKPEITKVEEALAFKFNQDKWVRPLAEA